MEETLTQPQTAQAKLNSGKESLSILLSSESPAIQALLTPIASSNPVVDERKVRRLYLQATQQQWFAPKKLDFELSVEMPEEQRVVWVKLMTIFYTLEKMGLNVISNMMSKAQRRLKSDEIAFYLSAQCGDEARHVFVIENYLKRLGAPPKYEWSYHVLGQAASMGFYRVENWLFSTLFSENFASAFLRRAKGAQIDKLGSEMCKNLLLDESRHLHFLHIVLPDIFDRLSMFGKSYVKLSQYFIMKFTERVSRSFDDQVAVVGINRRDLLEEVFADVERAYGNFGVSKQFLRFPKIH